VEDALLKGFMVIESDVALHVIPVYTS